MQCIKAIGFLLEHMMREDAYRERSLNYDFSCPRRGRAGERAGGRAWERLGCRRRGSAGDSSMEESLASSLSSTTSGGEGWGGRARGGGSVASSVASSKDYDDGEEMAVMMGEEVREGGKGGRGWEG
jgi:hypothetical protein